MGGATGRHSRSHSAEQHKQWVTAHTLLPPENWQQGNTIPITRVSEDLNQVALEVPAGVWVFLLLAISGPSGFFSGSSMTIFP